MAVHFLGEHDRLDVLINNAGVLPVDRDPAHRRFSAQVHDLCLAVNYLASFLLTLLLLPTLRASSAARIVNVSSAAQAPVDFKDIMLEEGYNPMLAYAQFEELEAFSRFGTRMDDATRDALERGRRVREILKQPQYSPIAVPEQIAVLVAVNEGVLDGLPVDGIGDVEQEIRTLVENARNAVGEGDDDTENAGSS
jgi:NAD(P)-dependent dehydrogenase (short-subunit alcohol dehydrogenase family)